MFAKDQGLIQRWNRGERPSTERENSSRRHGSSEIPAKQSSRNAGQNSSNPGQIGRHQLEGIIKTHPGLKPRNRIVQESGAAHGLNEKAHWKQSSARQEHSREENLPKVQKSTAINSKRSQDFNVLIIHQRFGEITQGKSGTKTENSAAGEIHSSWTNLGFQAN